MRRMTQGALGLGVRCLRDVSEKRGVFVEEETKRWEKKKKTRTEGNGEVDVANEGEVGGIGALGLDELEEGMSSLGEPR